MATNPSGKVSYTTASNNLITAVSELPEYLSRNMSVSDVIIGGGDQEGDYKADGTINTGYIHNWGSLSNAYKIKDIPERKKQGVKLGDWKRSNTVNELDNIK